MSDEANSHLTANEEGLRKLKGVRHHLKTPQDSIPLQPRLCNLWKLTNCSGVTFPESCNDLNLSFYVDMLMILMRAIPFLPHLKVHSTYRVFLKSYDGLYFYLISPFYSSTKMFNWFLYVWWIACDGESPITHKYHDEVFLMYNIPMKQNPMKGV